MTETWTQICIGTAVLTPLVAAALMTLVPRRAVQPIGYLATIITVVAAGRLLPQLLDGQRSEWNVLNLLPGVDVTFRVDGLGMTFGLLASGLWVLVNVYNTGYIIADKLKHSRRYLVTFAASIGSAMGVAFAGNLLTFLLFYELLTLATYPLVVHKEHDKAIAAGRRYLLFALSGGLALTAGAVWVWSLTGTLEFTAGGFLHGTGASPGVLLSIFTLLLVGSAVKAAVMPLHSWLPAAMVAPSPVSALLHAVAVVKAGVFACMRMLGFVFGPESLSGLIGPDVLLVFTGATIIVGSFIAVRQDNLKRRLAYSTIVHLSYIVLGAALLTPLGTIGSVFHMVNHGLCKITLFLCAGAIYGTYHLENVSQLRGVARRMPWTFAAFTVASLGLIGVPGPCGFISKLFLVRGAWTADEIGYLLIMLGGSVFTATYLLPIVRTAYFDKPDALAVESHDVRGPGHEQAHGHHAADDGDALHTMRWPLLGTAGLVIIFGIVPWAMNVQYDLAAGIAKAIYGGGP